jgi:hypothetical protein
MTKDPFINLRTFRKCTFRKTAVKRKPFHRKSGVLVKSL